MNLLHENQVVVVGHDGHSLSGSSALTLSVSSGMQFAGS